MAQGLDAPMTGDYLGPMTTTTARRAFPERAHRPADRVVHAVHVTLEGPHPEAVAACGVSLGFDYTEAERDADVTCRRCRRTDAAA